MPNIKATVNGTVKVIVYKQEMKDLEKAMAVVKLLQQLDPCNAHDRATTALHAVIERHGGNDAPVPGRETPKGMATEAPEGEEGSE